MDQIAKDLQICSQQFDRIVNAHFGSNANVLCGDPSENVNRVRDRREGISYAHCRNETQCRNWRETLPRFSEGLDGFKQLETGSRHEKGMVGICGIECVECVALRTFRRPQVGRVADANGMNFERSFVGRSV